MNNILKTLVTCGLSLLLLTGLVHVDSYHEQHNDYSICNIDCNQEKHHSITHLCEKCLTSQDRLIVSRNRSLFISEYQLLLIRLNENFIYSPSHFSLLSRPPPEPLFA